MSSEEQTQSIVDGTAQISLRHRLEEEHTARALVSLALLRAVGAEERIEGEDAAAEVAVELGVMKVVHLGPACSQRHLSTADYRLKWRRVAVPGSWKPEWPGAGESIVLNIAK